MNIYIIVDDSKQGPFVGLLVGMAYDIDSMHGYDDVES